MSTISLLSIDVGFDLRLHDEMEISIPVGTTELICEGEERYTKVHLSGPSMLDDARELGYRVREVSE